MAREFEVKTHLNADEYVAFKRVADDVGISQSGLLRMLVKTSIGAQSAAHQVLPIEGNQPRFGPIMARAVGTIKQEAA
jgi:antitoxin component of RelBE/YafQ-DinJ toxin-antitoxin module